MNKSLDAYDLPKLYPEDIIHINRSTTSNETETVIESPNKEKHVKRSHERALLL
jgi:hypothetical protein